MKTLFLVLTTLSLNTFANDSICYQFDPGLDQVFNEAACSTIDIEQSEDEGFPVFSDSSIDHWDGCLISEYVGLELSREYDSSVCEQGLDEGWYVLGRI